VTHRTPTARRGRSAGTPFRTFVSIVCLAGLVAGAGCASHPGTQLTVNSSGPSRSFTQSFATAYSSQDADGDTDIVLLDDASTKILDGDTINAPVRQVMHIRVLWKPTRDMKADHTSASNATLHWYVMGNAPAASGGVLEYAGTAMVVLEPHDRGTDLSIRAATLRPVASRGSLHDPIGPATLSGTIRATDSLERVRLALTSVRRAVAAANRGANPDITARNEPELPSSSAR